MARTRSGELTAEDLADLSASLAAGRRRTLWLREPLVSLGLAAGTSARVVSVDGTTVTVRPRGVDDAVPFEARELAGSRAAAVSPAPRPSRPAAPAPRTRSRAGRPDAVTVLLSGSADGGWTVEHTIGARRPSRPAALSPEAVARAVHALDHPATTRAVDTVLEHARSAAQAQVAELSTRLAQARAGLEALGG